MNWSTRAMPSNQNLAQMFFERAQKRVRQTAMQFKHQDGRYHDLTWAQLSELVQKIAFGLAALGLGPGDAVAIFSRNQPLWIASDFAIIANAARSTPIYPTSADSDIEAILSNSSASFVFAQNQKLANKVLALSNNLPALKKIILLPASPIDVNKDEKSTEEANSTNQLIISFDQVIALGKQKAQENPRLLEVRIKAIKSQDPATIVYTSGTTGIPKGAVLTHGNILSVLETVKPILPIGKDDIYLSYLPLAHVFERVCGEFYWAHSGGIFAFAESIESMAKNLNEVQPTMLLVVPRVLDRIHNKVKAGVAGASPRAQKLIDWALHIGGQCLTLKSQGRKVGPTLKVQHLLAEHLVFRKLRERIGKRLRLVVSGGAPATAGTLEFFNAIGIATLEGYGLTETCAPSHVNLLDRIKIGTVGRALPSVEAKIADDGEILLRGSSIVREYFKNEAATEEAFKDGWFHTGDIGTIDSDGYLRITDRKKDLIVNSSGKNIAPQHIENILKTVPPINQAVIFGDRQKSLVALITLDEQAAVDLAHEKNWHHQNYQELTQMPALYAHLRKEIRDRSRQLADYEQVKKFRILPNDLSVETGELTATLKIKRNAIAKRYANIIDELYNEQVPSDKTASTSQLTGSRR